MSEDAIMTIVLCASAVLTLVAILVWNYLDDRAIARERLEQIRAERGEDR